MNAGGYGNLLMNSEQPQGEYGVTIAFLRLITTLVKVKSGQIEPSEVVSLLRCIVAISSAGGAVVPKL